MNTNIRKGGFSEILIILLFATFVILAYLQWSKISESKTNQQFTVGKKSAIIYQPINNIDTAFLDYMPDFENLSLQSLPNMSPRAAFLDQGDLLVIEDLMASKWNFNDTKLLRVAKYPPSICNSKGSIFSGAKIGDFLYLACQDNKNLYQGDFLIYKQDVTTGKIIGKYFLQGSVLSFTNPSLISDGDDLWASGMGVVAKIDTRNNKAQFWSPGDLGYKGCTFEQTWKYQSEQGVFLNVAGCNVLPVRDKKTNSYRYPLVYDAGVNSWSIAKFTNDEITSSQQTVSDLTKRLPKFDFVSNKINGKTYLFTSDKIYTVEKTTLPALKLKIGFDQIVPDYGLLPNYGSAFVDSQEKFALILGGFYGAGGWGDLTDSCPIFYINLNNGQATNLLKNSKEFRSLQQNKYCPIYKTDYIFNQVGSEVDVTMSYESPVGKEKGLVVVHTDSGRLEFK